MAHSKVALITFNSAIAQRSWCSSVICSSLFTAAPAWAGCTCALLTLAFLLQNSLCEHQRRQQAYICASGVLQRHCRAAQDPPDRAAAGHNDQEGCHTPQRELPVLLTLACAVSAACGLPQVLSGAHLNLQMQHYGLRHHTCKPSMGPTLSWLRLGRACHAGPVTDNLACTQSVELSPNASRQHRPDDTLCPC